MVIKTCQLRSYIHRRWLWKPNLGSAGAQTTGYAGTSRGSEELRVCGLAASTAVPTPAAAATAARALIAELTSAPAAAAAAAAPAGPPLVLDETTTVKM
ncbi:hypothetical protein JYU34_009813 [Plutella xylostella]|uniref:Uncharacterized protein n=1 Tax=Plutella xylostella TaxID=51655 RepID=A0ABQ7QKD2_PLUXY|nr:hypothetical protein JYU34_009813 [Plutella xylostella]